MISSCFLSKYFNLRAGVIHGYGVQQVVYYLSKELVKLGIECCVISEKNDFTEYYDVFNGIPVYRVSKPYTIYSFLKRITLSNDAKFSVIHSHYTIESTLHAFYRKIQRHPQPLIIHVHHTPVPYQVGRFSRVRQLFKLADAVIAVNETSATRLHENYDVPINKLYTIYNGVDLEIFRPSRDKDVAKSELGVKKNVILYVGHCEPYRGIHVLLSSAPKILSTFPDTTFLLVGLTPETEQQRTYLMELERISKKLHLSDNVKIIGRIPHDLLSRIYSMADVFVMPDIFNSPSMTILEALACETPVVATNITESSILEYERAFLNIKFGDENGLAEAILKIISRPRLAKKLGVQGRKIVEKHFTWERVAKEVYSLYLHLLTDPKQSSHSFRGQR